MRKRVLAAAFGALPSPRDGVTTDRFARLALACIHKDYPDKISYVLSSLEMRRGIRAE